MSKHKAIRKTIRGLVETSLEGLQEIAKSERGPELGIFLGGENRVTFSRGLGYGEHEGEGLPEGTDQVDVGFSYRFLLGEDGKTELQFARNGTGRHYRFPFEGLDKPKAWKGCVDFLTKYDQFLVQTLYQFFWACYRKHDPDRKRRRESYNAIMGSLESSFKQLLIWDRYTDVAKENFMGLEIVTSRPVERGRTPGTRKARRLSDKEIKNQESRRAKIIHAIRNTPRNDNKSELARFLGISPPTLRVWLKSIGVVNSKTFYALIRQAESN